MDSEMVKTTSGSKIYYGQTGRTFKERYYGHTFDFRHRSQTKSTTLSTYVWNCRDRGEEPEILWSKHKSAKPYNLGNKRCNLCLSEKMAIAQDKSGRMLNRRREIAAYTRTFTNYLHIQPHSHDKTITLPTCQRSRRRLTMRQKPKENMLTRILAHLRRLTMMENKTNP